MEYNFVKRLDDSTYGIFLSLDKDYVVLLQGFLETYEGIGTIRSLSKKDSLVCIITTNSMLDDCIEFLNAIKDQIKWKAFLDFDIISNEIILGAN